MNKLIAAALSGVAAFIAANKAAIEADVAPLNVLVENDAVKFADAEAAKLAGPLAPIIEMEINKYGPEVAPELAALEGDGIDKLVAFLNAVAAKEAAA